MEIVYNVTWKGKTASIVVDERFIRRTGFEGQQGQCELTDEEYEQCRHAALNFLGYQGKRVYSAYPVEPHPTHHVMRVQIDDQIAEMDIVIPIETTESLPEVFLDMQQLLRKLCITRKSY